MNFELIKSTADAAPWIGIGHTHSLAFGLHYGLQPVAFYERSTMRLIDELVEKDLLFPINRRAKSDLDFG